VTRQACLIVNPSAGGGRAAKVLPAVEAALRGHGVSFHTEPTRSLGHARELARTAAAAGETCVTLSGDGLVGCVAGELRDIPDSVMGVLPGGRGNDFARCAGIPLDPEAACAVIADGVVRELDVGDIGGRTFIGIASLGFDSVANEIANRAPARLGNLVYLYGALRAVATWRHAAFTVRIDGEEHRFSGWSVAAGNSKYYGGGMMLLPGAELDDGALDVMFSGATSKAFFLRMLPKVFKGEHVGLPAVSILRGREIEIDADRPFAVYADGDPIGDLPVTVRAIPKAIRVLLPA
jgi:YegS/Rv2252/BmrU family lipid kinase